MKNQENKTAASGSGPFSAGSPIIIEDWLKFFLFFALALALSFLAVNQALGFFYKAQFLKTPCGLCGDLNPEVKICIEELNSPRASYWNGSSWTDPFNSGSPYIIEVNLSNSP